MRTKEQILAWLDNQPWKGDFYENCVKQGVEDTRYDEDFILMSFLWSATKQGSKYWDKIDAEYRKWYDSDSRPFSQEECCDINLKQSIDMKSQDDKYKSPYGDHEWQEGYGIWESGFYKGAQWMLERATAWIANQGSKDNDGVVMICVEDFQKAMEE